MINDATRHIKQCKRCLRFKALHEKAPMENINVTYPMELVHMDYLMNEANEGGKDVHILVITILHGMHKLLLPVHKPLNVQPKIYGTNSLSIMCSLKRF